MSTADAVEVVVAGADVDLASGLLWAAGVAAVAEDPRPDGRVVLRADVPPGGLGAVRAALAGRWPVVPVVVDDGLDGWRDHARSVRAGRRLVVHPPWVPSGPPSGDDVVLEVDPGRAFGHGAHPTTRLCLAAVEEAVGARSGAHVLDVGCGSGVLAVAAARLGSPRVVAVDVDPEAVEVTRANADRNGVAGTVAAHLVGDVATGDARLGGDPLGDVEGRFDVVVANIGEAALVGLARHLVARLAPGGTLVLSGLLDPPPARVVDAYVRLGVATPRTTALDGWTALTSTAT